MFQHNITPETFTFAKLQSKHAVYIWFLQFEICGQHAALQGKYFYIGSTTETIAKRHQNRQAKLGQGQAGTLTRTELAIRCWFLRQNFRSIVICFLDTADSVVEVRSKEHTLIGLWRPQLNPYITKRSKLTDTGFVPAKLVLHPSHQLPGERLWRRARRLIRTRRLQVQFSGLFKKW